MGDLGGSDKTVFDLYSGTGTIAQLMAPAAGKVIGVEIVEEAVEAAKKNAAANGLDNCEFIAGDVLKVLDEVEEKPDMIILDPPETASTPRHCRRSLLTAWIILSTSPANPPALCGIWKCFWRTVTAWTRPWPWTSSPGPQMSRRYAFCPNSTKRSIM